MQSDTVILQVTRRSLGRLALIAVLVAVVLLFVVPLQAQKSQEKFGDKFKIVDEAGGVTIAVSSDGRYVFVAGRRGVLVSDDYGKTGSWTQTLKMK